MENKGQLSRRNKKIANQETSGKKYFFSNVVQECLCKEPKGKRTRGQKYTLEKDRGRTAIYLRANNFMENCNQLL